VATLLAASCLATEALAQDQSVAGTGNDDEATEVDEIVVTGSSIRGVAPVGSNLVTVSQEQIEAVAATNLSQLVNTLPAISTAGAAPQGQNAYSYYSPQIHAVGGSASNTTLVIIDGLRVPGAGTQYAQSDPNVLPSSAIQRVEVLADGASSVYGSDAVAGVVNYIVRRSFNGLDVNGKVSVGDSYDARDLSFIGGRDWGDGGVYVAGSYAYQSALANADRPFMSRGDYRDIGGTNQQSYTCSPATIRTPASGGATYLSPDATTAIPSTVANAPCNNSIYGAAIPSHMRANIMVNAYKNVTDRLNLSGKLVYSYLEGEADASPGSFNNATVFGPGSGRGGQVNPFFRAPAGDTAATQESIMWLALTEEGNYGVNVNQSETIYGTFVADYQLTDDWTATFSYGGARSVSSQNVVGGFCNSCALLALNGTTNTSGNLTTPSVGGTNIIALNVPLTPDNALDVWSTPGSNRSSDRVIQDLYSNYSNDVHTNWSHQFKVEVQGGLFSLPAGQVRMAAGAEYYTAAQFIRTNSPNNTGPSLTGSIQRIFDLSRSVWSGYTEFAIPLVSPEMGIPLVESLDVNLSGRYDSYDDVGSTTNPKIAVNWGLNNWLRLRGNYAESFVAPPLASLGDPSAGYMRTASGAGISGTLVVPVALHPDAALIPGADCSAGTTCTIGLGGSQGLSRSFGGGLTDTGPQVGESWSMGGDFTPDFLPGFSANITYWSTALIGGVNIPGTSAIVGNAQLRDRLTLCPTGCTQTQINEFTRVPYGASMQVSLPSTVYYMIASDSGNLINLTVQGIDYQLNWNFETDSFGSFRLGTSGTYYTKYDQNVTGAPIFSTLNTSGYNLQFPSLQLRTRTSFGWDIGSLKVDLFANYTGSYNNWSSTSVTPILQGPGGPDSGGDDVDADLTFDANISYEFPSTFGYGDRAQVYLNVVNLTDEEPPFYNGNTSGIGVGGWGFNGLVSNPIGRVVSVGMRLSF
jgi:iron complex outermembrane receptor protein